MESAGDQMNDKDIAWMDKMATEEEPLTNVNTYDVKEEDFVIERKNAAGNITSTVFQHRLFADWLIHDSGEYFITMEHTDEIFVYIDGVYTNKGNIRIQQIFHEIMKGNHSNTRNASEVAKHVRALTYADKTIFDGDDDIINVKNGLYTISSGEFLPHSPDYKVITQNEVVFDPDATCPLIDKFFEESAEPDRLPTLYEIAGYSLTPTKNEKVGFILIGQPDTGKTQFNQVVSRLVGINMTATVSPSELMRDGHSGNDLFGKSLNVIDDLGIAPLNETAIIKALIGSGFIRVNPKNQSAFSFKPEILNIWCCNALPKTNDISFGDKFDLLYFNNRYGGHDEPDRHLIEKLTTEKEMSGLFNKAIEAYKNVVERGHFTGAKSSKEKSLAYETESRAIARFCQSHCKLVDESIVLKDGFQKAYVKFCHSIDKMPESNQSVKKYLADNFAVFEKKDRLDGSYDNPRWCYLGIKIVNENSIVPVVPNDEKSWNTDKPTAVDGFVPVVPTIFPIEEGVKNKKRYRKRVIGKIVGTNGNKASPDSENGENNVGTTGTSRNKLAQTGTSEDRDMDSKLKHAVGKAISKSDTMGAEASLIVECYPGTVTLSHVQELLEERGSSLGIKERYGKWYV